MFYLIIFGLFLVQEPVSADIGLLQAYQLHYNLWLVHALFLLATTIDILIGYAIGAWVARRWPVFFEQKVMPRVRDTLALAGGYGEYFFLLVIGPVAFPLSAIVTPLLGIPLRKAMPWMLLGEVVLWYGSEWLIVLGIKTIVPNPLHAIFGVVLISGCIALLLRWLKKRKERYT